MVQAVKQARGRNLGGVNPRRLLCTTSLPALMLLALPSVAHAQDADRNWDANSTTPGNGGTGTWDTSGLNWSPNTDGTSGPYDAPWNNALLDNAIFGGTAGTVTLGVPITVHNLSFNTNGYILTGNTLTLAGTTPTISVSTGTTTIGSIIAGSAGITKTGAGTLSLTGVNTFTGDVTVSGGALLLNGDTALGASGNRISLTGSTLSSTGALAASREVTVAGGAVSASGGALSARFTGAGTGTLTVTGTINNNANDYKAQTIFATGNNGFTSVANLGAASALGAPDTAALGTIVVNAGGTLFYSGGGNSSNRNWTFFSSAVFGGNTLQNVGTGTLTLTGDILLAGTALSTQGFSAASADMDVLGVISSGAARPVLFSGNTGRTITLGNANTYGGATTISVATVKAGTLANSGSSSSLGSGDTINFANGTLSYTGAGAATNRTLTISGASTIGNDGAGALSLSGPASFVAGGAPDTLILGGSYTGGANTFSGVLSGAGGLTANGAGNWLVSGNNSFTGTTTVQSGTLSVGNTAAFGTSNPLVVNGGTLDLNGFNVTASTLSGSGGGVALGAGTLTVNGSTNSSYAGSISGTGGLTKAGTGTLSLTGASTYTGATTISGGGLTLDFSGAGGPTSNLISASSTLNLAGGTLRAIGAASEADSQTFNGTNITAGNNTVHGDSGAGGSLTLNLGAINRTGGLVNFILPSSGNITTSNADGALGGWATINGSDYAKVLTGNIVAFDASDYTNQDNAALWGAGQVISDAGGAANSAYFGTVGSSVQLGGLRYTAAAPSTVTVAAGQTLGIDGTIIVAPSVLTNNQTISGGSITGAAAGGTLGVQQNGGGTFTIGSSIVDNGGATAFAKGGTGVVWLNGSNSYTGATTVSGGTLRVSTIANGGTASAIGASSNASSNLVIEGATLQYTGGNTTSDRGFTLMTSGAVTNGTIDVNQGTTDLAFSGLVTSPDGTGLIKTGAGTLTLSNSGNDYTGVTTVSGGTLAVNTLANGGVVSGIGASSSASSNLVLQGGGELEYRGGTIGIDRGFTLGGGGGAIDVALTTTTLTVSGTVVGNAGQTLSKNGAGILVLSGVNSGFAAGGFVNGGTLRAGSATALGSGGWTVASGATLDLGGFNSTIGGVAGSGTVNLGGATLTINSGGLNFSGNITGTGGVTKTTGLIQTFTGCGNSYTGPTTITGGIISVNCLANGGFASGIGASGSASSSLVIGSNGALSYTGGNIAIDRGLTVSGGDGYLEVVGGTTLGFSGPVVGAGRLRKSGDGVLVLSGANTFSGGTVVQAGTLRAGAVNAFGSGFSTVFGTGTLDLNGFNNSIASLSGGGATTGSVLLGSATLTITNGLSTDYGGTISGSGGLTKAGGGTQFLSGCGNSYTGTTVVSGGVLAVTCLENGSVNSSIGASASTADKLVLNGGALRYLGTGGSTDRLFTLGSSANSKIEASGTGAIGFANTGAIAFSSPNTAQTIKLGGTNTGNNNFALQITNNAGGVTSFTKEDAGTWILNNSGSTYTGVTTIDGGVLGVDKLSNGLAASSIGQSSNLASNLVIGNNSTLRYTGTGDSTDRLFTLSTGVTFIESAGTGAIAFTNTGVAGGGGTRTFALGGSNTGANLMGVSITNGTSGVTTLAKNDAGSWYLTGTNTYSGDTNVNAGTLFIGNGGTTGSITSATVNVTGFGALGFNRSDSVTYAGTIQGSGGVTQAGTGTTILTGANTYTGGTTISAGTLRLGADGTTGSIVGNVVNNGIFAFNRNNAYTFAGTISGTGAVSQVGSGTTTLSGTNSYQGGTDINAGTLQVSADANLGAAGGALRFNGGTLNTTASFTSTRATSLVGAGTFLTDPATTLTQNGAVSGTGTLTKTGTGTLILAADNSYTGLTTVSAGTLQIGNGGATGTLAGNVVNNGTLTFNRTGTSTYAGVITGTGPVNLNGGGAYTFTGDSNYSGGTTITSSALRLASGGSINTGFTQLSGTGAALTVDGVGSALTTGLLLFGGAGESGTVNVLNGGVATVTTGGNTLVGQNGTNPALVNIDGAGSLLSLNSSIGIGSNGPNTAATVNITNGGRLQSVGTSSLGVAFFVPTATKAMTVSGAGSSWANNGRLNFNNGSLSILDGGSVSATLGFMALTSGTADLLVSGANSIYSVTGDQSVANSIGTGIITLADGGRMSVSGALTAANAAGATAIFNIGGAEGQAAAAAGVLDAATLAFGPGTGRLNFNHTDTNYGFATAVSGAGTINQVAGVTRLTGNSSAFTGATNVSGGTLLVNGTLGDVTSVANVLGGGTLGGTGTIGGNVTVGGGATLAPGSNGVGALTIAGALNLASPNARLAFEFGQANAPGNPLNDVVNVGGNLTLDGAIDVAVSPGGSFDIGLYRIFNYGGALTNNGLDVGTLPAGVDPADVFVQTSIAGQVNLVNANGVTLNFWDGAAGPKFDGVVNGGNGVWQSSAGNDSWTDPTGQVNAPFSDNAVAIFSAASGTVTVDNSLGAVAAGGMQFASDGYVITGDAVTLANPQSVIRVGDGTGAGAGYTATINSVLGGPGVQLVKTDLGTLVLTGANTYTGGTLINAGTLRISSDASLGDAAGALSLDGAALNTTADIASGRAVDLLGAGTFATDAATTLTLNGLVSGAGALTKAGAGSLVLTNANNYAGGTTISAGTLRIGNGGTTGSIVGDVTDNGTLAFDRSDNLVFGGVISGTGSLSQLGSGILTLTANNAYMGGTTISGGTLQLGNGGTIGSVVGDVANGGTLIFNRSNAYSFAGTISGSGDVRQEGTGTTILTADNSYTGSTVISSGTLLINGNQTAAVGTTNVLGGGALGGTGTIGGDVFVGGGATLTPGDATGPGTLTINGNLGFSPNAVLAYEFGQSNVVGGPLNDLTRVGGGLTLDGTIDVTITPGGSFDVGLYRVISYGGTLTDNGLALGTLPAGSLVAVQTSVAGQVNLINAAGATLNFWDGAAPANKADNAVNGGDGIWQNSSGNNNWTELTGAVNGAYTDGSFAIFAAAPGTVSIDNSLGAVTASGLQFAVDGYTIIGQDLALVGPQSVIRVGDGTVDGLGYVAAIASTVTGSTQLVKTDLGTLILSGTNSYTGGTRINVGTLRISSDANLGDAAGVLSFDGGTLNTTANITSSRNVSLIGTGTFVTDAGTSLVFTGALSGAGNLIKDGAGILALNDTSNHTGTTTVRAGSLFVNGDLSAATGLTSVASGSTLGGSGIIGGDVVVADGGTLAPGNSPGTLTINGGLALNAGSVLNYEFGQANVVGGPLNDLVNIGGDLTLDGTINVTQSAGGSFGPGIYRVFNYAGALTDNGLTLGTMPGGSAVSVQTAVAGQVNLVNSAGLTLSFWDGAAGPKNDNIVQGGNGVWRVGGGSNNWTDLNGTVNADYAQDSYAIFSAAPGTVTVDNAGGNVLATGMQFASDGYTITGGPLTLTGAQAIVQVGDGTAASAGMTATIGAALTGSAQLVKTDAGTLVLTAASNYTGGTAINGGTIRISQDLGLGDNGGALSFDGGTLNTAADMAMIRNVNLVGAGTFDVDAGTLLTVNGVVSGGGGLVKNGAGLMVLAAANSYTGTTTVNAGILQVGSGTSGSILGNVVNNAQLAFARSDNLVYSGTISGGGSVSQLGTGVLTLAADSNYTGTTTISSVNAGTLQLGDGGTTGSIAGNVVNGGTLAFNRSNQYSFGGTISGAGVVRQVGSGSTVLTAANNYTGGTTITAGVLALGDGGTTGSITGDVANDGMLTFNRSNAMTFDGMISGSGTLHQFGSGTTILTGANSYVGDTTVSAGTLLVNGNQSLATGLTNALGGATLGGTGTIGGDVFVGGGATLAPGSGGVGTLTINGDLGFSPNATLAFEFGQANVPGGVLNDLIDVGGDLTLGGTIDVTQSAGGSFGPGVYRIINYAGALTNNGLTVGVMPAGSEAFVQTVVPGQVNLVNTAGLTLGFWDGRVGPKNDGAIQGGVGTWRVGGGENNWTEAFGAVNADYAQDSFAIFSGLGGTVTIDNGNGNVRAAGMQFAVDGYMLTGGPLELTGTQAFVRVGDGSAGDAAITATIASALTGSARLVKDMGGTLILTGANSYTGGTAINGGTLDVSSDANLGDAAGGLSFNGGTLDITTTFASSRAVDLVGTGTFLTQGTGFTLRGAVSGAGALVKEGNGTVTLTADNSHTGGTTINAGVLNLGEGGTTGSILGNIVNNGRFAINRSNMYTLTGTISGSGELFQMGSGTTILTAANSYTGATRVSAGTLLINGDQSAATGLTSLAADATLGGTGTIGGDVRLGNGTLAPGAGGAGTLTINGDLTMVAGSRLAVDFGAANAAGSPLNDLVNVGGNLTLDGTIDVAVTPGGAFDIGLYRIANYAGTLTNNGLAIGTMPAGAELSVQTSILGQVNLVNTGSAVLNFWDGNTGPKFNGLVNGGSGVWWATGTDNWTDMTGAVNAAYDNGAFAVFAGTSGLVTIDNGQGAVTASGLQFAASGGYRVQGGALTLTGPQSVIRVGDGTSAGLGYSAIIASEIAGNTQLVKTDLGRLELTGTNSYTGGTAINGGTVRISSDANLGAASGGISFNGGTLNTTADLTSARTVDLAGQGVFSTDAGTTLALTGNLTGAGLIGKLGAGTLVLAGTGSRTGGMEVVQGTLLVNGDYAGATGLVTMNQLTTLGGTGTIGGNVNLSGTLAPGANGVGTLTINGDLIISQLATLAYEFGQAGVVGGALNDLVNVGGNLILDGTINVAVPAGGAFDAGIYRVFNYGGTLTDNRLTLGAMPAGSNVSVQTSIAGQVNLVNSAGLSLAFWDGASGPKNNGVINGGTGIWQNGTGNDNWADASGAVNAPYSDGAFAVFAGTAGTVTVDNSLGQVAAGGMQFATSGYTITGGGIALTGTSSTIRVGDGSTGGAGYTATINSVLSGNTQLVKTDAGTLVLGGTNSYTGGTAINGGIVQITADANLGAATGGVTLDGGTLATSATMSSARDFALAGAGTISTAGGTTFTLSGTLTGTGAFTKAGAGTLVLTGDSSGYTGSTRIEGTLAVNGSLCGDVNVLAGARLQGTGTICTTHNAGTIAPGNSIGTLTVAGNYTGNGGTLEIEAELGGDASPADRLVVTGSTSGTTEVKVINTGGTGAATVEGIKIVDVGGTSNGVFTLDGDYVFQGDPAIIAGAYGYRLYKGGVATPTDGDWYLRSALLNPTVPSEPQVPLYQPGVPIYEAYGQALLTLNDIGTLQQRIGNRQWAQTESGKPSGIWGRMQSSRSRPNAVRSTSLSDVNIDSWKLELGADHVLSERSDGASLVLGVLGGYGEANASIASVYGHGSIKAKGYSAGATLTWFGPDGFYVDGRAQVTWFDSKLKSAVLGTLVDGNNGVGQAYSLELGKRSPVGDTLSVTPQIQMVYSTVGFDRFTDPNDAAVSSKLGDSLKTRWGISLDRQDATSHLYGVANLSYEWLDGTVANVSGTPIARENHRLWGELGLGGSVLLGDRLTLFSEVSGNTAINDFGKSYSLKGTAGLRLAF